MLDVLSTFGVIGESETEMANLEETTKWYKSRSYNGRDNIRSNQI
jgi:hypothetical protein